MMNNKLPTFLGACLMSTGLLLATAEIHAGPSSGRFDINSIDCNNLNAVNKRFRRIAERKCAEGKPDYTISNKGKIETEPTPADIYSGSDKAKFHTMIDSAWRKKYPQDKILGIRFHSNSWVRNANYKTNATGIYKTDTSVLPVSVVIQHGARFATIFPAYINKNNLTGSITAGVNTKKKEYVVKEMLLSNWKP